VLGERLPGIARDGLHQRLLVATLGYPQRHPGAPVLRQPLGERVGIGWQGRDQQLAWDVGLALLVAVDLGAEVVHQVAG